MSAVIPRNPPTLGMRKNVESAFSTTRLLEMSADCEELANWRTGKRKPLDHFSHQTGHGLDAFGPSLACPSSPQWLGAHCLGVNGNAAQDEGELGRGKNALLCRAHFPAAKGPPRKPHCGRKSPAISPAKRKRRRSGRCYWVFSVFPSSCCGSHTRFLSAFWMS